MCQVLASFITPLATILRLSAQRSAGGIEGLRHQLVAACEQKKATAYNRIGLRTEQLTILAPIQRCIIQTVLFAALAGSW